MLTFLLIELLSIIIKHLVNSFLLRKDNRTSDWHTYVHSQMNTEIKRNEHKWTNTEVQYNEMIYYNMNVMKGVR